MTKFSFPEGFRYLPGYLDRASQETLLAELRQALKGMPAYQATMPYSGKPLSVRMFSLGSFGWFSDVAGGYRYLRCHPKTHQPWPAIPERLLRIWHAEVDRSISADSCLVNHYPHHKARMSLHQDNSEENLSVPVVSLSLGAEAIFRIGGLKRKDATRSFRLRSGDLLVLSGPARLAYHGVDRVLIDSSRLLPDGGRINLTLRRVKY